MDNQQRWLIRYILFQKEAKMLVPFELHFYGIFFFIMPNEDAIFFLT
jgi:hypothetical protein